LKDSIQINSNQFEFIMPCSICGGIGHNRRTCPQREPQIQENQPHPPAEPRPLVDEHYMTILNYELELRFLILQDEIRNLSEEYLEFIQSLLGIQKKEFRLINLDKNQSAEIYLIKGNQMVEDLSHKKYTLTYIGEIKPRTIIPLISFTGYNYILIDKSVVDESINKYPSKALSEIIQEEYYTLPNNTKEKMTKLISELPIHDTMEQNIIIDYSSNEVRTDIMDGTWARLPVPRIDKLSPENENLFSLLKMNYLIQQMIRLGGLENENLGPILDLHQDIKLPKYESIDLEAAGLPNEFTNIT